jgi:hypothetical protein
MNYNRTLTPEEAMAMNRKDRRRLGKMNKVKIMGSRTDHLKKDQKPHALTTFTGKKI